MNEILNERIIAATKKLFLTTFKTNVEAGEPYLIDTDSEGLWDISGVISVTGAYSGLIAIRFKKSLSEAMLHAAQLSNLKSDFNDRLINDMIGELCNIITGNAFSNTGIGDIFLSIPVTIEGRNHIISWSRDPRITIIPLKVGVENFVIETELKKSPD